VTSRAENIVHEERLPLRAELMIPMLQAVPSSRRRPLTFIVTSATSWFGPAFCGPRWFHWREVSFAAQRSNHHIHFGTVTRQTTAPPQPTKESPWQHE
jgi:hypothetical protein